MSSTLHAAHDNTEQHQTATADDADAVTLSDQVCQLRQEVASLRRTCAELADLRASHARLQASHEKLLTFIRTLSECVDDHTQSIMSFGNASGAPAAGAASVGAGHASTTAKMDQHASDTLRSKRRSTKRSFSDLGAGSSSSLSQLDDQDGQDASRKRESSTDLDAATAAAAAIAAAAAATASSFVQKDQIGIHIHGDSIKLPNHVDNVNVGDDDVHVPRRRRLVSDADTTATASAMLMPAQISVLESLEISVSLSALIQSLTSTERDQLIQSMRTNIKIGKARALKLSIRLPEPAASTVVSINRWTKHKNRGSIPLLTTEEQSQMYAEAMLMRQLGNVPYARHKIMQYLPSWFEDDATRTWTVLDLIRVYSTVLSRLHQFVIPSEQDLAAYSMQAGVAEMSIDQPEIREAALAAASAAYAAATAAAQGPGVPMSQETDRSAGASTTPGAGSSMAPPVLSSPLSLGHQNSLGNDHGSGRAHHDAARPSTSGVSSNGYESSQLDMDSVDDVDLEFDAAGGMLSHPEDWTMTDTALRSMQQLHLPNMVTLNAKFGSLSDALKLSLIAFIKGLNSVLVNAIGLRATGTMPEPASTSLVSVRIRLLPALKQRGQQRRMLNQDELDMQKEECALIAQIGMSKYTVYRTNEMLDHWTIHPLVQEWTVMHLVHVYCTVRHRVYAFVNKCRTKYPELFGVLSDKVNYYLGNGSGLMAGEDVSTAAAAAAAAAVTGSDPGKENRTDRQKISDVDASRDRFSASSNMPTPLMASQNDTSVRDDRADGSSRMIHNDDFDDDDAIDMDDVGVSARSKNSSVLPQSSNSRGKRTPDRGVDVHAMRASKQVGGSKGGRGMHHDEDEDDEEDDDDDEDDSDDDDHHDDEDDDDIADTVALTGIANGNHDRSEDEANHYPYDWLSTEYEV